LNENQTKENEANFEEINRVSYTKFLGKQSHIHTAFLGGNLINKNASQSLQMRGV
jgi:hypothetical protein